VPLLVRLNANVFNENQAGSPDQYDQDVLWVDYLYVHIPMSGILPIIFKNAVIPPW